MRGILRLMDERDLKVLRDGIRMFSEGDIAGLGSIWAEDSRIISPEGWPEAGPREGRDEVIAQFARLREDWSRHEMTIVGERVIGDWAVVDLHWQAEGAASGAAFDVMVVGAYRFKSGQIAEGRFYWSLDEALADIGSDG